MSPEKENIVNLTMPKQLNEFLRFEKITFKFIHKNTGISWCKHGSNGCT